MQFIRLHNHKAVLRRAMQRSSAPTDLLFTGTDLVERTLYGNDYNRQIFAFDSGSSGQNKTIAGTIYDLPVASSYDAFDTDAIYQVPNTVGTTTLVAGAWSAHGGSATIKVTASEGDIVKSIFFVRKLYYSSSSNVDAVLYAVKLDNPVTIDSTGTANFTFAIEF